MASTIDPYVKALHSAFVTLMRRSTATQGLTKVGDAPANIDAALTWLQHCQRFDLSDAVAVGSWPGACIALAPMLSNQVLHLVASMILEETLRLGVTFILTLETCHTCRTHRTYGLWPQQAETQPHAADSVCARS